MSLTFMACGKFECELCGEEKTGKSHKMTLWGEKITVCDDCYREIKEIDNEISDSDSENEHDWENDKPGKKDIEQYGENSGTTSQKDDQASLTPTPDMLEKVDVFENINIIFSGTAPFGVASLDNNCPYLTDYYFKVDKLNGISNGDTVTVQLTNEGKEYLKNN